MDHPPPLRLALARGLRRRCPRCGAAGLFTRWFRLARACPSCGLVFEQEEGYWLGAVMLNTGVTEASFVAVLVGGMALTWPDVPWVGLLVVGVLTTLILPVLLDPVTRTTWVALERTARRWSETEIPGRRVQARPSQDRTVAASSDETVA